MTGSHYLNALQQITDNLQGFTATSMTYYRSINVQLVTACYGWLAVNTGDVAITVNDFPLVGRLAVGLYGGFFGYMDNGRIYKGDLIRIKFPTPAGGTDPQVVLTQIGIV